MVEPVSVLSTADVALADALSLAELRAIALDATASIQDGEPLDPLTVEFIALGVRASVTTLDRRATERAIEQALAKGATIAQVQEVIALVSGLGVHSLMISTASLLSRAKQRHLKEAVEPLDERRQALWQRYVGDDPYWLGFEREVPGFVEALLRLSPDGFVAFFDYCAVPWKSGSVRARNKELIAMACDATPSHRFLPGFKVHLRNALGLGVGRAAILETLDIAGAAPLHEGTR